VVEDLYLELTSMLQNHALHEHVFVYERVEETLFYHVSKFFSQQTAVKEAADFEKVLACLTNFEFMGQGNGDYIVRVVEPPVSVPVVLNVLAKDCTCLEAVQEIQKSPFAKKVSISFQDYQVTVLCTNAESNLFQISLPSKYSSLAFTQWLERYYAGVLAVVFDSQSAVLQAGAQPYCPKFVERCEREKKKTVAKMYQYYNSLFIQQHLERVSELGDGRLGGLPSLPAVASPEDDLLLRRCASDEDAAKVLGLNRANSKAEARPDRHPEIAIRYSNAELLAVFKKLGRFEHPLTCAQNFKIGDEGAVKELTKAKPNVVIELLKEEFLGSKYAHSGRILGELKDEITQISTSR